MVGTVSRLDHFWVAALVLLSAFGGSAQAAAVHYRLNSTGQTAAAAYNFVDGDTLEIVLTETTQPSATTPTGGSAILTGLGFTLPTGGLVGGNVQLSPGSTTFGFTGAGSSLGGGADVSGLWGYTQGSLPQALQSKSGSLQAEAASLTTQAGNFEQQAADKLSRAKQQRDAAAALLANNPDAQMRQDAFDLIAQAEQDEAAAAQLKDQAALLQLQSAEAAAQAQALSSQAGVAPDVHFVGILKPYTTAFAAAPNSTDLIGPGAEDGIQGGLLANTAARDGLAIVDDSVKLTVNLLIALDTAQQAQFLNQLLTTSVVAYGDGTAYATAAPVTLPPTVATLAAGLLALTVKARFGLRSRFDS